MFMQHIPEFSILSSIGLDECKYIIRGTDIYRFLRVQGNVNGFLSHRNLPNSLQA